MAIQEILSSLQERLQRWTSPDRTGDLPIKARGQPPPQSYEAALWAARQKMMETATTLQSDLDRLNRESMGRSCTCNWSSSQCRMQSSSWRRAHSKSQRLAHSQGQSEDQARPQSQDCHQTHLLSKWAHSPNHTQELLHRWVSFHTPEGRDAMTERKEPVTKLAIRDLEALLEHQAGQLGTPTWWRELEAVQDIEDPCKFAQKIWASFYVPEVRSWTNPSQLFSMPPAPRKLNRGAFYPKGLEYQDVRQRPTLLTVAYCQCSQHWVEKHRPPKSPEAHPLARSMRELLLAVGEFMHITARDILEGLDMNQPKNAAPPPFVPLFSQVLSPPVDKQEATPVPEETCQANVVMRPCGRAQPFPQIGPTRSPIHMPRAPIQPVSLPAGAVVLIWSPALP